MKKFDNITIGRYEEKCGEPYPEERNGYVFLETTTDGYSDALIIGKEYFGWWYGWAGFTKSETEELLGMSPDGMAHKIVLGEYDERGMSCGYFDTAWEAIRDAYTEEVKDDDEILVFIRDTVAKGEESRKETR